MARQCCRSAASAVLLRHVASSTLNNGCCQQSQVQLLLQVVKGVGQASTATDILGVKCHHVLLMEIREHTWASSWRTGRKSGSSCPPQRLAAHSLTVSSTLSRRPSNAAVAAQADASSSVVVSGQVQQLGSACAHPQVGQLASTQGLGRPNALCMMWRSLAMDALVSCRTCSSSFVSESHCVLSRLCSTPNCGGFMMLRAEHAASVTSMLALRCSSSLHGRCPLRT